MGKYKTQLLCNGDEEINNHLGTTSKLNKYSALFINKDAAIGQRCKCRDSYRKTKSGKSQCGKQKQRSKRSKNQILFQHLF